MIETIRGIDESGILWLIDDCLVILRKGELQKMVFVGIMRILESSDLLRIANWQFWYTFLDVRM